MSIMLQNSLSNSMSLKNWNVVSLHFKSNRQKRNTYFNTCTKFHSFVFQTVIEWKNLLRPLWLWSVLCAILQSWTVPKRPFVVGLVSVSTTSNRNLFFFVYTRPKTSFWVFDLNKSFFSFGVPWCIYIYTSKKLSLTTFFHSDSISNKNTS